MRKVHSVFINTNSLSSLLGKGGNKQSGAPASVPPAPAGAGKVAAGATATAAVDYGQPPASDGGTPRPA